MSETATLAMPVEENTAAKAEIEHLKKELLMAQRQRDILMDTLNSIRVANDKEYNLAQLRLNALNQTATAGA